MDAIVVAIILGIVEGLTEFLPVSSTGHLIIATDLLKQNQEALSSFNIIIQFGAILAVVYLYWNRFVDFFHPKNLLHLKKTALEKKLNLIHIALAVVPVAVIGLLTRKFIKAHLFNSTVVTATLVIVGVMMILIEKYKPFAIKHSVDEITYADAFIVGLSQCFALIPGFSRSGATILMAMLRKIDLESAADFSFLISVPVISGATILEAVKARHEILNAGILPLLIGLVVSFVVAIIAIKTFLKVLKHIGLAPFAYYRIIFGAIFFFIDKF
jgi:undecaprenyl-diphosphatase